jgi:hypothetical protein
MNRDVELPDLDEPYRSKSCSLRLSQRNYAHDSMTGSYPSSLVSSRSPSPCALDNPVRAAAKRSLVDSLFLLFSAGRYSSPSNTNPKRGAKETNTNATDHEQGNIARRVFILGLRLGGLARRVGKGFVQRWRV